MAKAEEVEEGLVVREGDVRDTVEARGLDEVSVLNVMVLREEDGGRERVGVPNYLEAKEVGVEAGKV